MSLFISILIYIERKPNDQIKQTKTEHKQFKVVIKYIVYASLFIIFEKKNFGTYKIFDKNHFDFRIPR